MWKKKISQCQIDDVITFDHARPHHILPQKVSGHLVGITFTEPLEDGKDINYLIGFKDKPFDECWDNDGQVWFNPTTLSKKIDDYKYFWYLTEEQEVEVLLAERLVPTPAQDDSDREVVAMISEGNPICEAPTSEKKLTPQQSIATGLANQDEYIEPIITIEEDNSSISVPYTIFTCALCGRWHISHEKDKHNIFKIPSTIDTSRLKMDAPNLKKSKGEIYFHCKGRCP